MRGKSASGIPRSDSRWRTADSRRSRCRLSAVCCLYRIQSALWSAGCSLALVTLEVNVLGVTAIIAAYNEENTIADVLSVLTRNPLINEVIVVSDGSTDATVDIARQFDGVRTISLRENHGKGYAMKVGVDNASHDIFFFVDGDMYNVSDAHIETLVLPVLRDKCDMNIGVRNRGAI